MLKFLIISTFIAVNGKIDFQPNLNRLKRQQQCFCNNNDNGIINYVPINCRCKTNFNNELLCRLVFFG